MRVMFYDKTQDDVSKKYLSFFWAAGGKIGNFDHVIPVSSWDEACDKILLLPDMRIHHIQFWGHGYAGNPVINGGGMRVTDFKDAIRGRMFPHDELWLRACDTFKGPAGHAFAKRLVDTLDISVVGHTRVISAPFFTHQSGGQGLRPGQSPRWDINDSGYSTPWAPNTCLVTRMNPPDAWWQRD